MIAEIDTMSGVEESRGGNDADVGLWLKETAKEICITCNIDLIHTSFLNIGSPPGPR